MSASITQIESPTQSWYAVLASFDLSPAGEKNPYIIVPILGWGLVKGLTDEQEDICKVIPLVANGGIIENVQVFQNFIGLVGPGQKASALYGLAVQEYRAKVRAARKQTEEQKSPATDEVPATPHRFPGGLPLGLVHDAGKPALNKQSQNDSAPDEDPEPNAPIAV